MPKLTQERLKLLVEYDPATGVFIWKPRKGNRYYNAHFAGKQAGYKLPNGTTRIAIDGKQYAASKLAILFIDGKMPFGVTFSDGNPTNERFINILPVAKSIKNQAEKPRQIGIIQQPKSGKWTVFLPDGTHQKCNSPYEGLKIWDAFSSQLSARKKRTSKPKIPTRPARRSLTDSCHFNQLL